MISLATSLRNPIKLNNSVCENVFKLGDAQMDLSKKTERIEQLKNKDVIFMQVFNKLLLKHKIKPLALAAEIGLPNMTVHQWTTGTIVSDPRYIEILCTIFECDRDYLFFGDGMSKSEKDKLIEEAKAAQMKAEQDKFWLENELKSQLSLFETENTKLKEKLDQHGIDYAS
ncbi:hypothetical protein [Kangiella sp.]|uniref:hypothetical protein n=1 Tax=Kangiella sp. TaxID=1920245 RepID=UPI003A8FB2AF